MNVFELGSSINGLGALALSTAMQTTVVILAAALLATTCFRRRPELRHATWITALVYVVLSPAVAFFIAQTGVAVWEIPLAYVEPQSEQSEPQRSPQATVPIQNEVEQSAPANADAFVNPSERIVERESLYATPSHPAPVETGTIEAVAPWYADWDAERVLCGAAYLIWITGSLLFGFRFLHGWRSVRSFRKNCRPLNSAEYASLLQAVAQKLGLRKTPPVATSTSIDIPVVTGIFRPIVLLPERMLETFSREQLHEMLLHEFAHVARRDLYVAFVQRLAGIVFWPHPFVHYLNRSLSQAREELCDNYVLEQCSPRSYARTLLAVAESCAGTRRPSTLPVDPAAQLALVTPHWNLEQRITGLLDESRSRATSAARIPAISSGLLLCTFGTVIAATRLEAVDEQRRPNDVAPQSAVSNPNATGTIDSSKVLIEGAGAPGSEDSNAIGVESARIREIGLLASENGDLSRTDLYGDPLPAGASTRLGTIRFRHPGWNKNVAFTSDAKILLSCADDNVIRYWETSTGKLLREIHVENQHVRAFRISLDGKTAATLGFVFVEEDRRNDRNIKLWDVATGKLQKTIRWYREQVVDCEEFEFLPDGRTIVTGNRNGVLRLFDLATGKEKLTHRSKKKMLNALAVSPDGNTIAFSNGGHLQLWKWLSGAKPVAVETRVGHITGLAFSPDGEMLAAAPDSRKVVQLLDVESRKLVRTLSCEPRPAMRVQELRFTPDGKSLLATDGIMGFRDGLSSVIQWDVESGELRHRFKTRPMYPRCLDISRNGRWLAAAGSNAGTAVWDLKTGARVAVDQVGHESSVSSIRFSPQSDFAVTASDDGTIRTWDVASGRPLQKIEHDYWVRALDLSPNGKWIASSSLDDTVRLWDASTGEELLKLPGHGRSGGKRAVAFLAKGTRLATWGGDMNLRIWELPSGKQLREHKIRPGGIRIPDSSIGERARYNTFEGLLGSIGPHGFSQDGATFCLKFKNVIYAYDVEGGAELQTIDSEFRIRAMAVSPDGKRLLTSGPAANPTVTKLANGGTRSSSAKPRAVRLFNLKNGSEIWKYDLPAGGMGPLAFSPDGEWMSAAVGLPVQKIFVWNVASQQQAHQIDVKDLRQRYYFRELSISLDNRKLALGTGDASVLIWDLPQLEANSSGR